MAGKQLAPDALHLRQRGRHHHLRQGQDTRKAPLVAGWEWPSAVDALYLWAVLLRALL